MDTIDLALTRAWNAINEIVRHDRAQAARRFARTQRPALRQPPRAWCLCIRASDTRISEFNTMIEPECMLPVDQSLDAAVASGIPHTIHLTGDVIRQLCAPVHIPWPGVPTWIAAEQLGMSKHALRRWMNKGHLHIDRYDPPRCHGKRGKPIPIVYTPSPLDPNNFHGRPPHPVWGSLWQYKHEKIPEEFEQPLQRVPRLRPLGSELVFRGYDWVCPGRLQPLPSTPDHSEDRAPSARTVTINTIDHVHVPCNRPCHILYAPLPVWTIPQALGDDRSIPINTSSDPDHPFRLAGEWRPGFHDPPVGQGTRTFACKHCWNVRNLSLANHVGWNDFVSCITGGLLYGREVERPLDEAPRQRIRRPFRHQQCRPHPRRDEVHRLLQQGLDEKQIARRMGITVRTVRGHIELFNEDQSRALRARSGSQNPAL